ncbi:hypothetical protein EFM55_01425 [Lactiplantibacillus pentosus]|nr:hypothetical protein [Lactiplantibacillus pentosus]
MKIIALAGGPFRVNTLPCHLFFIENLPQKFPQSWKLYAYIQNSEIIKHLYINDSNWKMHKKQKPPYRGIRWKKE